MTVSVKKRNGTIAPFTPSKIHDAIYRAFQAVEGPVEEASLVCDKVLQTITDKRVHVVSVEAIQDIVEETLIALHHVKAARAYIKYREQHAVLRNTRQLFDETFQLVDRYLERDDWKVAENSNMSFSLQGLNYYITADITSHYWLNKVYPSEVRDAHKNCEIHIHDLGLLSPYCCGWDLMDLLIMGFGGVEGKISSSPPRHLSAALGQIVNFFYTLQGEAAGAQAFSNVDTLLAPMIRYDGLSYKATKQHLQEFVFNLNVPTRVGFQTPFTNITMDLKAPSYLETTPVIIGGVPQKECYGEFQHEMDLFNQAFCEVMMEGDYQGRIFTFPIPTYNITRDFDWEDPNLRPLWAMTAKYGVPYFSNFINSEMNPEDARSMCCRLRLDNRELRKRGGGLFASNPMTGSVGVVTLNLPRMAYEANCDLLAFDALLEHRCELARKSLMIKRKVLERYTDEGLYPFSKLYLGKLKEGKGQYWQNHFNTIGVLGMNEACLNLFGENIAHEEGKVFSIGVLKRIRDLLARYQQEDNVLYNLEATPGESTAYRFAKKDKADFPDIITSGNDVPYYTNSTHLPVEHTPDIFEALEHQDELQGLYTGGTVLHGFIGESLNDPSIAKVLVRRICENFRLPYFTITPTFSICSEHGFIRGEHHTCPYHQSKKLKEVVQ